jgi:hypothetical protein
MLHAKPDFIGGTIVRAKVVDAVTVPEVPVMVTR